MTVNHYPIGEVTDRPEWTAVRGKTPEEVQAVAAATLRQFAKTLTESIRQAFALADIPEHFFYESAADRLRVQQQKEGGR